MDLIFQKFKNLFVDEAQNLINSCEADLLRLEASPNDTEAIESAFRNMHTLKGTSSMYGFIFINQLAHKLESILQAIRDKKSLFSKAIFEAVFNSIDHLRNLLNDELLTDPQLKKKHEDMLMSIEGLIAGSISSDKAMVIGPEKKEPEKVHTVWQILLNATESHFFRGISYVNIFKELTQLGTYAIDKIDSEKDLWDITLLTDSAEDDIRSVFMFIEDDCSFRKFSQIDDQKLNEIKKGNLKISGPSIMEAVENVQALKNRPKEKKQIQPANNSKRISIPTEKLDHLMFLVSELITVNSQLTLSLKQRNQEKLEQGIEKIDFLSRSFRNNALELRLVPLTELVLRFQRLIRDLSKQLGKKIEFQVNGGENELDKSTIDMLFDPLMHIIRNSIDHGIEKPDARIKKGKSEIGIIKLSAFHSSGKIVIKIGDDGNGIDLVKIREKAVLLGLLKHDEEATKKQLLDMIFIPGFSTAKNLTDVSGRGVGMDVVKKKIQELHGEIAIETAEKEGTTFTISLQQSISIIDSLLFSVGDSFFTLPISEVEICSEITSDKLAHHKHTCTIPHNNELIPIFDLRCILDIKESYPTKLKVIIFKHGVHAYAIVADKILGEHQAVLKPLKNIESDSMLYGSVSQLGTGEVAFMIDTNKLINV